MSNQSIKRPVVNLEDVISTFQINVEQMGHLFTLLDNMNVSLDLLLNNPELSIQPGKSRSKVILLNNTVAFARDLLDRWTDDLDAEREQLEINVYGCRRDQVTAANTNSKPTEENLSGDLEWQDCAKAAMATLKNMQYSWIGGALWRPPRGSVPDHILNNGGNNG